ncbi:MAG TPA: NAD(P)/FAD-dependent oxidoreductase [Beijerinckiaceae bacterium]|jgi:monoamine oxidase
MKPVSSPALAEPPRNPDVVIVGAGAAGIAAARRCLEAGLSVAVLEARGRVGGRAVTALLKGHPVDLGPHWLHNGPDNPLVHLAAARGEPLRRAPVQGHLFVRGRPGTAAERRARRTAFELADHAFARDAKEPQDRAAASALPLLGPWREPIATVHGLVGGRPLAEVSLKDVLSMDYADNRFIAGGLGAYVARLARGLPVSLGTAVTRVDVSGPGVAVETGAGTVRARAAIVTVPPAVLQRGAIRFEPALPPAVRDAIHAFVPGIYEHVVLHWPGAPFHGPDRLASFLGTRHRPPGMLTRIDGTPFHYFELDHPTALRLDRLAPGAAARFARQVLIGQFGARAIRGLAVPAVTDWRHDPLSRGSWSVVPPGLSPARDAIKAPVAERLWLTGEFASRTQWGTVGGAWQEGERAAGEAIRALGRAAPTASTAAPGRAGGGRP